MISIAERLSFEATELSKIGINTVGIMSNDVDNYPEDSFDKMKEKLEELLEPLLESLPKQVSLKLPKLEIGDYIIFKNIGSYSIVFNMPFHCQTKPTIIMKKLNDDYVVIRNRENVEDLFKNETYSI